jgi:serine carboxypeptidase-like clade 1
MAPLWRVLRARNGRVRRLWYAHKNGLVADPQYHFLTQQCGYSHPVHLAAGSWHVPKSGAAVVAEHASSKTSTLEEGRPAGCVAAWRAYLLGSSKSISQSWDHAYINELSFYSPSGPYRFDLPGTFNYRTQRFMNDPAVRRALHVESAPQSQLATAWPGPQANWSYHSSYDACNGAPTPDDPRSMVDFYRELAPALPGKVVVFNGDTDPCVSYEGTRTAIEAVGFNVTQPARPWFFNFSAASADVLARKDVLFGDLLSATAAGAQFGGQVTDYEHGLSFATVHGSGHSKPPRDRTRDLWQPTRPPSLMVPRSLRGWPVVPTFRPRAALQLIAHVVQNTSFAPDVPELGAMSDAQFDTFLDRWVADAKTASFVRP